MNPVFKQLVLATLEAYQLEGMDYLPTSDNMPLEYLIKAVENEDEVGRMYVEMFRQMTLDEINKDRAFSVDLSILKGEDGNI